MMERIKVACIGKNHNPSALGGLETFQRNLNIMLKDYDFKIYVYPTDKKKIFSVSRVIEIGKSGNFIRKFLLKILGRKRYLKMLLKKWRPDIIIINTPNDLKFLKHLKAKIILVQHSSLKYYMHGTFDKQKVVKLINERLDRYVFLSPQDKEKFNDFLCLPEEKVEVIRHTCNVKLKETKQNKTKSLVMVTRLDREKKVEYVVEAMRKLKDFTLKIYGYGEQEIELKKLIKNLKLNNVMLMGKTLEVEQALDQESIFVMSSDFEGYPISCIEAARRGLPIILRDTFSSAKDIVQGNGVLLGKEWNEDEFVEAVKMTYDNYEEYSKKSLELGKRHSIDVIKKEWENLFKELKR